jgi:hypothetical protein
MDINGAKALKHRIGDRPTPDSRPASGDISEDAPPVYHWTGVSKQAGQAPQVDDDEQATGVSLFQRLGLSFR